MVPGPTCGSMACCPMGPTPKGHANHEQATLLHRLYGASRLSGALHQPGYLSYRLVYWSLQRPRRSLASLSSLGRPSCVACLPAPSAMGSRRALPDSTTSAVLSSMAALAGAFPTATACQPQNRGGLHPMTSATLLLDPSHYTDSLFPSHKED